LLLIKALFTRAGTAKVLEECLYIQDELTTKKTDELRICSEVISEDKENFTEIILRGLTDSSKNKFAENYKVFVDKIDEWLKEHTAKNLDKLVKTLLYKIVLLPIACESEDDALTIFTTINDRGMTLNDADIFKAKLYHNTPKSKQSAFINDWSRLSEPDRLFRVYMHILRANKGDTSKEKALRTFFKPETLKDSSAVMASLKKIHGFDVGGYGDLEKEEWAILDSMWAILSTYPNQYWNYPLYVFLHKHGTYDDTLGFSLPDKILVELNLLLFHTVRYFFIKGVVHNSVNIVKDTTFRVCAKIAAGDNYIAEYISAVSMDDKKKMYEALKSNDYGRSYRNGLVLLAAYLNTKQNKTAFAEFVSEKYDIEHILPKKWNNYDSWTESLHESHLDILGNLIPLEREINISASNEFLKRKKAKYKDSAVQDARDIACGVADNGWIPQKVCDMHKQKLLRLKKFFEL